MSNGVCSIVLLYMILMLQYHGEKQTKEFEEEQMGVNNRKTSWNSYI